MKRTRIQQVILAVLASASATTVLAQVPVPVVLTIDVENSVQYFEDTSDITKLATLPGATGPAPAKNFGKAFEIDDIVAVNGQPVKGTLILSWRTMTLSPAPGGGGAIADITRNNYIDVRAEILQPDGTPIGTLMALGLGAGAPPPGAPVGTVQGNNSIIGGTGAFLGVRGQVEQGTISVAKRQASITEDPAARRANGGGKVRFFAQLFPMVIPQVIITNNTPAIVHSSDFTVVNGSKPAAAGEILSAFVTGLGPTRPSIDPGTSFPSTPLAVVNSPVSVAVNGVNAEVLGAVGFPESLDAYQVNFRVPAGTAKGTASVQISAAWIAGSVVNLTVQ